MEIIKKVG